LPDLEQTHPLWQSQGVCSRSIILKKKFVTRLIELLLLTLRYHITALEPKSANPGSWEGIGEMGCHKPARLPSHRLSRFPFFPVRGRAFSGLSLGAWKGGAAWADLGAGRTALEGARPRVARSMPLARSIPLATSVPALGFSPPPTGRPPGVSPDWGAQWGGGLAEAIHLPSFAHSERSDLRF